VHPAGGAGLPGGELAAGRVERPVARRDPPAHERGDVAVGDEPEVGELHVHHHRVVVVDGRDVDLLRASARRVPQLGGELCEAGAQPVALLPVGVVEPAQCADAHAARRALARRDHDRVGAAHDRNAVVPSERIGHDRGFEVLLQRERLAVHRTRVAGRPPALRDGEVPVVLGPEAVCRHVPPGHERELRVRPEERDRREVVARGAVVAVDELGELLPQQPVAREEDDRLGIACLDRPQRVLEHVDPGSAARRVLRQPAEPEPESPGEVDRVVGTERERRHAEAVDGVALDAGPVEHAQERVREQRLGGDARPGVAGVRRLGRGRDHRLARHGSSGAEIPA
jgi:hypothetical protein